MELYILKSAACLAIFYSFYKLVLEKESMHTFKRLYLLGALFAAFAIPLITFTTYIEATELTTTVFTSEIITSETPAVTNYVSVALWSIYFLGLLFFSLKFFRNLGNIIQKIRSNPKVKINRIINVLLKESIIPHTFFSYIFLNKEKYETKEIPEAILIHEEAHAVQKHSLDILFIEVLQIVFWFNPLIFLIKHSIKLNHEFLADQAVLKHGVPKNNYQNILVAFSSNAFSPQLANSINYSSIKKRITVMKTHSSQRNNLVRTLILLPLTALLIFGFSTKKIVQKEAPTTIPYVNQDNVSQEQIEAYNKMAAFWNQRFAETNERIIPLTELKKLETIYREMTPAQRANAEPFPECDPPKKSNQEKATPEQIAEYNKLAKKYNSQDNNNRFIKKSEVERIKYLYGLMSEKQKKNAEPFPNFPPPPPPPPKAPKAPKADKVIKGVNDSDTNVPPPPPPPPPAADKNSWEYEEEENGVPAPPPIVRLEPLDHIIRMAKENAAFFYEGKSITSDKAIDLIKKNESLNIETETFKASNPIVKITTKGVTIEK